MIKMMHQRSLFSIALLVIGLFVTPLLHASSEADTSQQLRPGETSLPNVIVENAIQRMFASVKEVIEEHGAVTPAKMSELVEEIVMPIVDEPVMAQFVLGRTWTQMSSSQKREFIQLFKEVMIHTYAGALSEVIKFKPNFFPFKHDASAQRVTIRLEITRPEGPAVPMQFRLRQTRDGWKVYDALVDGISLVANYRNLYADIVRNESIEGMLKKMRTERDAAISEAQ
jgi:phospholipid transport system substrate-binding protein